jgi:hypothetical protein
MRSRIVCSKDGRNQPPTLSGFFDLALSIAALSFGDFLAIDSDVARRLDPNPNLSPVHRHDGDLDIVADA